MPDTVEPPSRRHAIGLLPDWLIALAVCGALAAALLAVFALRGLASS